MSLKLKALKLLIRTGLAQRLAAIQRLADGNAVWLKYYSDSVLDGPGPEMRQLRDLLETRAADPCLAPIDLTFGAPEAGPVWNAGFAELLQGALASDLQTDDSLGNYPPSLGHPRLKALLADKLAAEQQLSYRMDRELLITNGASQALSAALNALVNPGERVVLFDPSFFMYSHLCRLLRARIAWVPTTLEDGMVKFGERQLRRAMRGAKVVIVNSPSNPTGCVIPVELMQKLVWTAKQNDVILISDEVYEYFSYGDSYRSTASLADARQRTLIVNSFSKSYRMPAFRVGYIAGPEPLVQAVTLQQVVQAPFVPTIAQRLAIRALERQHDIRKRVTEEYLPKRGVVLDACRRAELNVPPPAGAFYAWVPVDELGMTGSQFALQLAATRNVLCMPGRDFGPSGMHHVRLSFGGPIRELRDGMDRFVDFVQACRSRSEGLPN